MPNTTKQPSPRVLPLTANKRRTPETIWMQVQGIVAEQVADPDQLAALEDDAALMGLESPELLMSDLARLDPQKAVRFLLRENPQLPLWKLEQATPKQKDDLVLTVLEMFKSRSRVY